MEYTGCGRVWKSMKGHGSITNFLTFTFHCLPQDKEIWCLTKIGPKPEEHIVSQSLNSSDLPFS